jgi:hypothetical protein
MYLARSHINGRTHYTIRQSYATEGCLKSRDLYNLGPDPARFIRYPGGNSYYIDPCISDILEEKGVVDEDALDRLFFEFLRPEIQKIVIDFDRGRRRDTGGGSWDGIASVHDFDKRRYHYLRFGHSSQKFLNKVPPKIFGPLTNKSRDELEQYFRREEQTISWREKNTYLMVIFQLNNQQPSWAGKEDFWVALDRSFLRQLCRLNEDEDFLAGTESFTGLHPCLVSYAIDYFDGANLQNGNPYASLWEFIGRHRRYVPPRKVRLKVEEAETLLGRPWKELKAMGRSELGKRYRKAAIRHHPDQGGDPDTFRRLTGVYQALLDRKK